MQYEFLETVPQTNEAWNVCVSAAEQQPEADMETIRIPWKTDEQINITFAPHAVYIMEQS